MTNKVGIAVDKTETDIENYAGIWWSWHLLNEQQKTNSLSNCIKFNKLGGSSNANEIRAKNKKKELYKSLITCYTFTWALSQDLPEDLWLVYWVFLFREVE